MTQASGDYVAFIDAGVDINLESIATLLEHVLLHKADVVVASKRHPASKVNYPFMRKLYSWGYYTLARLLFNLKLTDTQAGLKVFKREVLDAVLPRLLIKEFAFDIEMLAVAHRLGFRRIYEAPIELSLNFDHTTFSKFLFLDSFIQRMMNDTLAVFYRLKILKYYDDGNEHKWIQHEIAQFLASQIRLEKIEQPEFSVIVTERRLNKDLRECLAHLSKLDYPYFEVIVLVDEINEVEEKKLNLGDKFRFIAVGNKGPGEKRNIGAGVATGNILAFLDDDAFPKKDWLKLAAEVFKNSNTYALGAPAVTPPKASFLERIAGKLLESSLVSGNTIFRHKPTKHQFISDYPTVNLFVRRDAFLSVGGFTTEFWPGEDTKLCLDLVEKFRRPFPYDPKPIVYHHRRKIFLPYLKQISRYGQHRGQFARLFPETSRLLFYFMPTLFVLGLVLGPIVSSFFPVLWYLYFTVVGIYLFLILRRAAGVAIEDLNPISGLLVFVGIILTHIVYGINFIIGLLKRPKLQLRSVDINTGNYLGG